MSATASFRLAVDADPASAETHVRLATCLAAENHISEAIEHLEVAERSFPNSLKILLDLAILLQRAGEMGQARSRFERALRITSDSTFCMCGLMNCKTIEESDRPMIERLSSLAEQPGRQPRELQSIHFALGRAFDSLGDYERAMAHWEMANQASRAVAHHSPKRFDIAKLRRQVDFMIDSFTAEFMSRAVPERSSSELPVLIIGMPRSGTTLLDQILSSHKNVGSAGELEFWKEHIRPEFGSSFIHGRTRVGQVAQICSEYRILLRKSAPNKARVIDKMPLNWMVLGFIHMLFPNARFIHCRRHPVDTCLSIFATEFTTDFGFSRSDIVAAYRQYLRAMEHWRKLIPADRFFEVDYEAVVSDREAVARKSLDFLGLEWNESVLHHEQNKNVVNTPSVWQVRQPIYKTSVERWRNYEPWLGEFRELLKL